MGQFSLKRLFASVTLFAIGSAVVVAATHDRWPPLDIVARSVLWMIAGASVGATVFMPFKSARTGAIVGALIGLFWALGPASFQALD